MQYLLLAKSRGWGTPRNCVAAETQIVQRESEKRKQILALGNQV